MIPSITEDGKQAPIKVPNKALTTNNNIKNIISIYYNALFVSLEKNLRSQFVIPRLKKSCLGE